MTLTTDWSRLHQRHFHAGCALVTGGAGFIGSHLTRALLELGASVVVLDDLSGGSLTNLESLQKQFGARLRFVQGDVLDQETVARCVAGTQWVFHQAALGSVPRSIEMPRKYMEINSLGTLNVLEAARNFGVQRVMFAASSSAYGDSPTLPKVETMPVLPKSPYAASKVASEAMLRAWSDSYGLDTVSLRYFNIFGPNQNANSAYAAVIAAFAKAILAGQSPVIFGDGEQSRDFTFVHNAVHANLLAARCEKPLRGQVFNVACGQRVTVNELALEMLALLGRKDLKFEHRPDRAGEVKHSLASLDAIGAAIGYDPIVGFSQGLQATVTWYKQVLPQAA